MRGKSTGALSLVTIVFLSLTSIPSQAGSMDSVDSGWEVAVPIETDDSDGHDPQVVVDDWGNALAIWLRFINDPWSLSTWSSQCAVGGGWNDPEHVTYLGVNLDMAVDAFGNAVVVGRNATLGDSLIISSRYVPGLGWDTASTIGTSQWEDAPKVAVDESGNAIAVWVVYPTFTWNGETIVTSVIGSNRYEVGSGWGDPSLLGINATANATEPQVAVDGSGNGMAVWRQYDGNYRSVWANRYEAGSGWGTATPIEAVSGNSSYPQIAMDRDGNAIAVWGRYDDGPNSIWSNRYEVDSGWGDPTLIETDDGEAYSPQIAIDRSGNAIAVWSAVWSQDDGRDSGILSNRYVVGSGWGATTLIEINNTEHAADPHIVVDGSGNAIAVWRQWNGTLGEIRHHSVVSNHYIVGEGWGTAVLIGACESGAFDVMSPPQIAINPSGDAVVVWSQFDGDCYNVWSNRYVDPDSSVSSHASTIIAAFVAVISIIVIFTFYFRRKNTGRSSESMGEEEPPRLQDRPGG